MKKPYAEFTPTCIPFLPKLPGDEDRDRRPGLTSGAWPLCHISPPIRDVHVAGPDGRLEAFNSCPFCHKLPNAGREPAQGKEVQDRFRGVSAEGTEVMIWSPPDCEPVRSPKLVLNC